MDLEPPPFFVALAPRSKILRWADETWHVLGRPLTARLNGGLKASVPEGGP